MQYYFERLSSDYADAIKSFAVPMVIAIFTFAFPLLFQTVSRIDNKYNSTLLIKVFRKERICRWFIIILFVSLICCAVFVLQLPRLIDCGEGINVLIDNSSLVLSILSTLFLVFMTISSMYLMYIYYMPNKLLKRLKNLYYKANSYQEKELYFESISNILFYSMDKSVLVCVDMNTEVRCRKEAKCIQIKAFSQFDNIGNPNNPQDVKFIWSN